MDIGVARQRVGNKVALQATSILRDVLFATPEVIRNEVKRFSPVMVMAAATCLIWATVSHNLLIRTVPAALGGRRCTELEQKISLAGVKNNKKGY